MRKQLAILTTALGVAIALAIPAGAADLQNSLGDFSECESAIDLHFVNPQTGGEQTPGTIQVWYSGGGPIVDTATKVNNKMQHFEVTIPEGTTLVNASTNLDGKLVLSDYSCDTGKKDDPKDPKK
jgi:hypothetical protein